MKIHMKLKLIIAGIGNLIDAVATFILTQYLGFKEINPIMAWLLQWPVLAMVSKIIVVTSILFYAYYTKRQQYMNVFATFAALLYGSMGVYYIVSFVILFLKF